MIQQDVDKILYDWCRSLKLLCPPVNQCCANIYTTSTVLSALNLNFSSTHSVICHFFASRLMTACQLSRCKGPAPPQAPPLLSSRLSSSKHPLPKCTSATQKWTWFLRWVRSITLMTRPSREDEMSSQQVHSNHRFPPKRHAWNKNMLFSAPFLVCYIGCFA